MAGVFTKRNRFRRAITEMLRVLNTNRFLPQEDGTGAAGSYQQVAENSPDSILGRGSRSDGSSWTVHEPRSKDSLFALLRDLCTRRRNSSENQGKIFLVLAGGDGFHKDVCSGIQAIDPDAMDSFIFFRLPMGTGNDSSDAPTLAEACELFLYGGVCVERPIIKVTARGAAPDYCFNVFSLGIDGFVCLMTERFKRVFPGGIFKIMADFSAVFYDLFYPTLPMRLTITGGGGVRHDLLKRFALTVVVAEGPATYGGSIPVLPTDANLCLVDAVPLLRKLALKKLLYTGEHWKVPETTLYSTRRVRFDYPSTILGELDGEPVRFDAGAFPITAEIIRPGFTVFRKGSGRRR